VGVAANPDTASAEQHCKLMDVVASTSICSLQFAFFNFGYG
jgi:hypothetical protein